MTSVGGWAGLSSFDLHGRLAVVTGARRGLGLAIARALASAGADIVGVSASLESSGSEVQAEVEGLGREFEGHRSTSPTAPRSPRSQSDWPAAVRSTSWSTTRAPSSGRPLSITRTRPGTGSSRSTCPASSC